MPIENTSNEMLYYYGIEHLWAGVDLQSVYKNRIYLNELSQYPEHGNLQYSSTVKHPLPSQDKEYRVFWFPKDDFNLAGVGIELSEWTNGQDLSEKGFNAYMFNSNNYKIIPKSAFYMHIVHNDVVVVVESQVLLKLFGKVIDMPFSLMFERDHHNSIVNTETHYIGNKSKRESVFNKIDESISLILVNGRALFPSVKEDIPLESYVELYWYRDTVHAVDIEPLSDTFSASGSTYDLIHIPKSKNKAHYLIPSVFCEMYMYEKNNKKNSYWIDRHMQPADKVEQLTHQDFAVPESLYQHYLSYMDNSGSLTLNDVRCRLIFRNRYHRKTLGYTKEYIRYLYTHTDNEILEILRGNNPDALSFWEASSLISSRFAEEVNEPANTEKYQSMTFQDYMEVFGIYNAAGIICPKVQKFYLDETTQRVFALNIPPMFNEQYTKAHVFIDGLKVPDEYVSVSPLLYRHPTHKDDPSQFRIETGHRMVVELDQSVDLHPDNELYAELIIELYEDTDEDSRVYTGPDSGTDIEYDPDFHEMYIEESVSATDDQALIDETFTKRYRNVNPGDYGSFTGDKTFTFDSSSETFIIQNKLNTVKLIKYFEDQLPEEQEPNSTEKFDPVVMNLTDDAGYPVIAQNSECVYLNGNLLVRDVDYCVRVQKDEGHWVHSQVIVQNTEYVQQDNLMEVYVFTAGNQYTGHGYSEPVTLFGLTDHFRWKENLSILSRNGDVTSFDFPPVWKPGTDMYPDMNLQPVCRTVKEHEKGSTLLHLDSVQDIMLGDVLDEYVYGVVSNTYVLDISEESNTIETSHPVTVDIPEGTEVIVRDSRLPAKGALCSGRLTFPYLLYNYMSSNSPAGHTVSDDESRMQEIQDYFSTEIPARDYTLFVPNSHKIYSVLVSYIVREMMLGNISLGPSYSVDDLDSLISEYEWIANLDLVFNELSDYDRLFVDVYPSYSRYLVSNRYMYQFTQDLIRRKIDSDNITTGDLTPDTHKI